MEGSIFCVIVSKIMELRPAQRVGAAGLALAASLALGSAGCSAERPEPKWVAGAPACLDGPTRTSLITFEDRVPLATSGRERLIPREAKPIPTAVGAVTIRGNTAVMEAPALAEQYRRSVANALREPYVGCGVQHVKAVRLLVTNGPDGAFYQPDSLVFNNPDTISLEFTDSDDPKARMFKAEGGIRAALAHEVTHSVFDEWTQAAELPPAAELALSRLTQLYAADVKGTAEGFRKAHGKEVVVALEGIRAPYAAVDEYSPEVWAIDYLIGAFKNGLSLVAVYEEHTFRYVGRNTIQDMLYAEMKRRGVDVDKRQRTQVDADMGKLEAVDALYEGYLEKLYPANDESSTLAGFVGEEAGAPYESLDEWIASTIASDQTNPDAVLAAIPQLSSECSPLAVEGRKQLMIAFNHLNSKLVPHMQTPGILGKL